MSETKIPEDVFEGRCRWCVHRQLEENKPFEKELVYREWYNRENVPCRISTVAGYDRMPGECLSFAPNYIYGICKTCAYNNCFHEGYCTNDEQKNKRQVYIGHSEYGYKADYWQVHELSTCDGYEPASAWVDTMRQQATEGKIPRNFDPETMKPTGTGMEAGKKWEEAERIWQEAGKKEKAREEAEKMRTAAEAEGQVPGQISMAELM